MAVLVLDHADKIRDEAQDEDHGQAQHDHHTVEVLVDSELED